MKRIKIVVLVIGVSLTMISTSFFYHDDFTSHRWGGLKTKTLSQIVRAENVSSQRRGKTKVYNITWFNPPIDMFYWPKAIYGGFNSCEYTNCRMNFDKDLANQSDAVIFNGRAIQPGDFFQKKRGQIWIFFSIESPLVYGLYGSHWAEAEWVSSFNWTMTYDKSNTDIYLPYGEIRRKVGDFKTKDFRNIFRMKNKTALIVHSNCHSFSKREEFVEQLGKFMDIDALGKCGKPWNCGQIYKHDDCFQIINNYKFYLAFENAFCDQYFTEKIFRNFNYDSLMVIRGGRNNDTKRMFPSGTYISTEDFNSLEDLAKHLNEIANSEEMYVKLLKKKNRYYSVPYEEVYQKAMCELCERMNKQNIYKKQIQNISEWAYGRKPCDVVGH